MKRLLKPLKLLSEVEEMIEVIKEILMVVGSATVALVVACFLTGLEEKIKSWRKKVVKSSVYANTNMISNL